MRSLLLERHTRLLVKGSKRLGWKRCRALKPDLGRIIQAEIEGLGLDERAKQLERRLAQERGTGVTNRL